MYIPMYVSTQICMYMYIYRMNSVIITDVGECFYTTHGMLLEAYDVIMTTE